jgi:hypothetical protein
VQHDKVCEHDWALSEQIGLSRAGGIPSLRRCAIPSDISIALAEWRQLAA